MYLGAEYPEVHPDHVSEDGVENDGDGVGDRHGDREVRVEHLLQLRPLCRQVIVVDLIRVLVDRDVPELEVPVAADGGGHVPGEEEHDADQEDGHGDEVAAVGDVGGDGVGVRALHVVVVRHTTSSSFFFDFDYFDSISSIFDSMLFDFDDSGEGAVSPNQDLAT